MLDHTSISVKDYDLSLKFYDETLKILGYERLMTIDIPEGSVKVAGYGPAGRVRPMLWISPMGNESEDIGKARGVHMAFSAPNSEAVAAWHAKCLELGGEDNGAPGVRPEYHPGYFGAFIVDPSGWRIEACFHEYKPK